MHVVLTFESVDEILWCDHSNDLFSSTIIYQVELYRFVLIFDSRHSWVNSTLTHPHRKKLARISSIIGPSKSGSTFLLNTVQLIVEFN